MHPETELSAKIHLLIVGEDISQYDHSVHVLSKFGYECTVASLADASALCNNVANTDIVICDLSEASNTDSFAAYIAFARLLKETTDNSYLYIMAIGIVQDNNFMMDLEAFDDVLFGKIKLPAITASLKRLSRLNTIEKEMTRRAHIM